MKKYFKYIIFGITIFSLIGFTNVEAKKIYTCKYEVNFSELLGAADDKKTEFTIVVTDGQDSVVDDSLESSTGSSLFGNNWFSWKNNFDSDFNTLAKKDSSCPSVRFTYYDSNSSILGTLSSYNDQMAFSSIVVNGKSTDSNIQTEQIICTRTSALRNQSYEITINFAIKGDSKVWRISGNSNDSGYISYDSPITDSQGNMFTINSGDTSSYFGSEESCKNTPLYLNIKSEISTGIYSMTIQSEKPEEQNNGAFSVIADEYDDGLHDDDSENNNVEKDYVSDCSDIPETITLIKQIYNAIRFLIPIVVIGLSIVDFLKVLLNGEEKVYKTAWSKFIKRIVIGIVILILPIILSFIIDLSGIAGNNQNFFCIFS